MRSEDESKKEMESLVKKYGENVARCVEMLDQGIPYPGDFWDRMIFGIPLRKEKGVGR